MFTVEAPDDSSERIASLGKCPTRRPGEERREPLSHWPWFPSVHGGSPSSAMISSPPSLFTEVQVLSPDTGGCSGGPATRGRARGPCGRRARCGATGCCRPTPPMRSRAATVRSPAVRRSRRPRTVPRARARSPRSCPSAIARRTAVAPSSLTNASRPGGQTASVCPIVGAPGQGRPTGMSRERRSA